MYGREGAPVQLVMAGLVKSLLLQDTGQLLRDLSHRLVYSTLKEKGMEEKKKRRLLLVSRRGRPPRKKSLERERHKSRGSPFLWAEPIINYCAWEVKIKCIIFVHYSKATISKINRK